VAVSGFMFRSSVLRPPEKLLPFWFDGQHRELEVVDEDAVLLFERQIAGRRSASR
jgi:hypothetical protein